MGKRTERTFQVVEARPKATGVRVAKVLAVEQGGAAVVDYPGNPLGPIRARRTAGVSLTALRQASARDLDVLLTFANHDPSEAIVFDVVMPPRRRDKCPKVVAPRPAISKIEPVHAPPSAAILGRIAGVKNETVFVDYEGNPHGPTPACAVAPLRNLKDKVLLMVTRDGPVIVGQVYPSVLVDSAEAEGADVVLKGRRIRIEAGSELLLQAGQSTVHLDARGKISVLSDHVVSRARGANKVQGGCVQLN